MPYTEFRGWQLYFKERPVGWREDYRAALQIEASGAKISREKIFPSLAAMKGKSKDNGLKNSALFRKMLGAKGGDALSDIVGDA
jgi:hypothetical protein